MTDFQYYAAEYSELKAEQRDRIRTRDNLYLAAFAFYGALISFALSSSLPNDVWLTLAFVASMIGYVFFENEIKISNIRAYLKAKRVPEDSWEDWIENEDARWIRKLFQLLFDLTAFSAPSFFGLWLSSTLNLKALPELSWYLVAILSAFVCCRTILVYFRNYF